MIRKWLRRWLGVEDIKQSLYDWSGKSHTALQSQIDIMCKEVEALKYMRTQREAKAIRRIPDWEQVQADFAADPKNFEVPANLKEN